jgi:hypothetical protein
LEVKMDREALLKCIAELPDDQFKMVEGFLARMGIGDPELVKKLREYDAVAPADR